jgi:hypothetical protein
MRLRNKVRCAVFNNAISCVCKHRFANVGAGLGRGRLGTSVPLCRPSTVLNPVWGPLAPSKTLLPFHQQSLAQGPMTSGCLATSIIWKVSRRRVTLGQGDNAIPHPRLVETRAEGAVP